MKFVTSPKFGGFNQLVMSLVLSHTIPDPPSVTEDVMLSCAGSSTWARLRPCLLADLILVAAAPTAAFAQAVTGTLLGTVSDSTGAVVTGAKVTITNQNTGFTRTAKTDAIGEYTAPSIPTGVYTVMAEMDGFKATALSQIQVGVDQRVRIDVTLEVGAMTESVTIEAQTPLLQTSSSELGTTVKSEQIEAMPLNGRNFVSLTRTVPGVLRGNPGSNIDGAGSLARLRVVFGQRPARPRQQLHARRRGQQRDVAADGRHLPECGRP